VPSSPSLTRRCFLVSFTFSFAFTFTFIQLRAI
jgi:hypothetical protein